MNKQIIKARWKQIGGRSKILRGKITHNRKDRLTGRINLLVGELQEKFSYSRQKAVRGIEKRKLNYKSRLKH